MTLRTLCLLLLLGLNDAQARAADTLVYAFSHFEPFKTLDDHGQPAGPYTRLLQELTRRSGLRLEIHHCPLPRCLAMLEQGRADISIGLANTPQRAAYLDFIDPPYATPGHTVLLQRGNDPRQIRHYQDLYHLRVGVVAGVSYFPRFDHDEKMMRDTSPSARLALQKLAARRFDVLMMNSVQAEKLLQESRADPLRRAGLTFSNGWPRRIALSRHSAIARSHKATLKKTLRAMLRDGSTARILAGLPLQAAQAGSKRSGRSLHNISTPQ